MQMDAIVHPRRAHVIRMVRKCAFFCHIRRSSGALPSRSGSPSARHCSAELAVVSPGLLAPQSSAVLERRNARSVNGSRLSARSATIISEPLPALLLQKWALRLRGRSKRILAFDRLDDVKIVPGLLRF